MWTDVQTAVVAKEALEGHCIYDGGFCKLHISYSRHTDLSIKVIKTLLLWLVVQEQQQSTVVFFFINWLFVSFLPILMIFLFNKYFFLKYHSSSPE